MKAPAKKGLGVIITIHILAFLYPQCLKIFDMHYETPCIQIIKLKTSILKLNNVIGFLFRENILLQGKRFLETEWHPNESRKWAADSFGCILDELLKLWPGPSYEEVKVSEKVGKRGKDFSAIKLNLVCSKCVLIGSIIVI